MGIRARRTSRQMIWQAAMLLVLALSISHIQASQTTFASLEIERGLSSYSVHLPIIQTPAPPAVFSIALIDAGFLEVIDVASIGDGRLFIVEKDGWVKVRQSNGTISTFLDISNRVSHSGERGVLGLAFDLDYGSNGHFYVAYTGYDNLGNTRSLVSRFSVSADPNIAVASSELKLLDIKNENRVHNGGALRIHPLDGNLYTGIGDDQLSEKAQNDNDFRGKLIRVDKTGSQANTIVAKGFRNPWRVAIDAETGDFYVGDVGSSLAEEIDRIPYTSTGLNFGWPCMEGFQITKIDGACSGQDEADWIRPIHDYAHGFTQNTGCAITMGLALPDSSSSHPRILFGDYCLGDIRLLTYTNNIWSITNLGNLPNNDLETTVFAPDGSGNIIVGSRSGAIYKLTIPEG